ncbi:MAG: transglutaminase-like domain-containing protein, partial [Duncaniella sp.]|nr:transglutaminase-like domain-containing protein [Duncaniella sp.]
MKRISLILLFVFSLGYIRASNENVVIENYHDVYRVVPTKDCTGIKEIKNSAKIDYRTRRTGGTAYAGVYYNDRITIDKVSGGKAAYGMTDDEDIFYSDSKVCVIELPMKRAGDKATAKYDRTFKDPKYFSRTALTAPYDVENYIVSFIIPNSLAEKLRVVDREMPDGFTRSVENNGKETVITYALTGLKSPDKISRPVSRSLTVPTLYLLGAFSDYNDLYRYVYSLTKLQADTDSLKVEALARELTRDCDTDSAKIAAVYDYVHDNIRYIAVEHGIYSHMPDLPSEVLRKRFGDCKGSAGLIRALLRGAGIDGRYVWIGTKEIPTEWTEFPVLSSGNHMIAAAVTGDSILYLDGTATHTPLGQMPAFIRGRQTLVEGTANACLVGRVPDMPAGTDGYEVNVAMEMSPDGGDMVSAAYHEIMRGSFNSSLLGALDGTDESKRDGLVTDYVASGVKGSRVELKSVDRSRKESVIDARMTISNVARPIGDDIFVNLSMFISTGALTIDTKDRPKAPAMLRAPFAASVSTSFSIPDGYKVTYVPDRTEISNQWFTAMLSPVTDDVEIRIGMKFDLTLKNPYIPADQVDSYVVDVRRLQRAVSN